MEISTALAAAVEQRMTELGYTPTSLARATGLSLQAIKNVRRGEVRQYQPRLTLPLCAALHWSPSSVADILAGGQPTELDGPSRTSTDSTEVDRLRRQVAQLAELTLDLKARVVTLEQLAAQLRAR